MFKLKDILAKDKSALSEAEKAFLIKHMEALDDDMKEKYAEILVDNSNMDEAAVKALISKSIDEVLAGKVEKMAGDLVAKFEENVDEARKKALDAGDEAETFDDQDNTRDFIKALLDKNSVECKRISTEAWKEAVKSKDKDIRKRAKAMTKVMSTSTSGESPDDAQAGLLLPPELINEVLRIKQTQYGLARRDMRYLPFSGKGNSRTIPALGTSVSVYWTDEAGKKRSTQAKFSLVTQTLKKLAAIVPMTEEILEDSLIDINGLLGELFAEAVSKEEDLEFFNGDGTHWTGILQNGDVNEQVQASGAAVQLTADDLLDMINKTPTAAREGAKFYMHSTVLAVIQKLKSDDGQYIWGSPAAGKPGTIWGKPYEESDAFPTLTEATTGIHYILFGNLKMAAIFGDKQQLRVKLLDQATITDTDEETVINLAEQDMLALRIVERVGYVLALPTGVTVLKAAPTVT